MKIPILKNHINTEMPLGFIDPTIELERMLKTGRVALGGTYIQHADGSTELIEVSILPNIEHCDIGNNLNYKIKTKLGDKPAEDTKISEIDYDKVLYGHDCPFCEKGKMYDYWDGTQLIFTCNHCEMDASKESYLNQKKLNKMRDRIKELENLEQISKNK